jgi:hypothetical protein
MTVARPPFSAIFPDQGEPPEGRQRGRGKLSAFFTAAIFGSLKKP